VFSRILGGKTEVRRAVKCVFQQQKIAKFCELKKKREINSGFLKLFKYFCVHNISDIFSMYGFLFIMSSIHV
jgi:hypothetical protein